jgi:GAF domain-containing protein
VADTLVRTDDITTDARWPALAPLLADTPIRAVLGVPIHAGGSAIGSLNVYRSDTYTWDASDVEAIGAFGGVVEQVMGAALVAESREVVIEQLRYALDSRVMIERAVGVLMSRDRASAPQAFEQLRSTARSERRKVAEVARELLASLERTPESDPPPATLT